MNANGGDKQSPEAPPYFSGTTFANFVEGHRRTQPTRFDRSIMSSIAGGDQSRILKALRFFGLSDVDGRPTDTFASLEKLDSEGMQHAWGDLLARAYPFLFSGFNLEKATQSQLEERFREQGIQGDTVRKAVAFFITLARIAGLSLSPYFKTVRSRSPRVPKGVATKTVRVHSVRVDRPRATAPVARQAGSDAKTITFRSGGTASLVVNADLFALSAEDRSALFGWIDAMTEYENASADDS
jgi:hypothetical protein